MTMIRTKWLGLAAAAGAVVVAVGGASASCSQTPTNVAVRTFELAQKMDVVCLQVNDVYGYAVDPVPLTEDNCAPVALNTSGAPLPNHLFAVVTQLARGELAVVDLTAGNVVDEDRETPGINFIPVGAIPTDVAVPHDTRMAFVASGDAAKPAIYGIPTTRLLGDTYGAHPKTPLRITDLLACALPQPVQGLKAAKLPGGGEVLVALLKASGGQPASVVAIDPAPLVNGAIAAGDLSDGGAPGSGDDGGGGAEAGAVTGDDGGDAGTGGEAGAADAGSPVQGVTPGSLSPCKVLGATAFLASTPATWSPGVTWPDGVPYVEGGVDLTNAEPVNGVACTSAGIGDAGTAASIPFSISPDSEPKPAAIVMRDDVPLLYVSDEGLPLIHVIDLSDPTSPREQTPLLATSVNEPSRQVSVGAIALSPPTRDYKRYLYATDSKIGSMMVFDVTDPASAARTPMLRPHPELNPFNVPDRLAFNAPVAAIAFVEHDWPLPSQAEGTVPVHQYSGLLCNPNPNAHPDSNTFNDKGAYYRADQAGVIQSNGTATTFPQRLRGIFAFVTLSNGSMVVIDVDDWDAPCRRPDPMEPAVASGAAADDGGAVTGNANTSGMPGVLAIAEPAAGTNDLDPYHAPNTYADAGSLAESPATTIEAFFPISVPNRMRSNFLVRNDPSSGDHVPNLIAPVLLFDVNGAPLTTTGTQGLANPLMLPTPLSPGFSDPGRLQNPTEPNPAARSTATPGLENALTQSAAVLTPNQNHPPADIRISFDDPTAEIDQDWATTYEGALPTVGGVLVDVASYDGYRTLTLAAGANFVPEAGTVDAGYADAAVSGPSPGFCGRGIEDWAIGQQRAFAVVDALQKGGLPAPGSCAAGSPTLPQWTADYVELNDDLLPSTDAYWGIPSKSADPGATVNDCWDDELADVDGNTPNPSPLAQARYNACFTAFDAQANADTHYARDFPIVEAYDDHLVLGRFGWLPDPTPPPTSCNDGGTGDGGASNGGASDGGAGLFVAEQPQNRVVVGADDSNKPFLRFARCCFHHQATFKVRTGGEWVTTGSVSGYMDHTITDPKTNRCVMSCNQGDVLRNSRAFDVPWGTTKPDGTCASDGLSALPPNLDRNSVLAMRNPMFSFVIWSACTPLLGNDHTETARDMVWRYSLRGGFSPLTLSITGGTSTAVSPQSMRFIDSLGQLAVIDGSLQGLVLFDLNSLSLAHNPYF
jgi:hypothetical protein